MTRRDPDQPLPETPGEAWRREFFEWLQDAAFRREGRLSDAVIELAMRQPLGPEGNPAEDRRERWDVEADRFEAERNRRG